MYDVAGRLVREVANGEFAAGTRTVRWDGADTAGRPVSSGVYFCLVESGGASATQRVVVLR